MVWVGNAFLFSFIYHIFSKHFLNIKYVLSITLGPEDTKIKSVWSLTTRGPLSYRRRNQKVWSTSSLIANVLLTPVLWPGIRWHGPAVLLGAFKLVRSQPGSPSPAQHSFFFFASFYHSPGQSSQPFPYSPNTATHLLRRQSTSPTAFPESMWESASIVLSTLPLPLCI